MSDSKLHSRSFIFSTAPGADELRQAARKIAAVVKGEKESV